MSHDWLNNNEAIANIKRLLVQMGTPLESRVARICDNKDVWFHNTSFDGMSVGSGRLIYGNTSSDIALREVDQNISVHTFIDVGDDDFFDISLGLEVLVECKHRDSLAVFGFPYQRRNSTSASNPIVCEFAFADFIKDIYRKVPFLQADDICTIGLLDNMQKSPRVCDEQLIYKAGASLYDLIRFSCSGFTEPFMNPVIQQMGLIEQFKEELKEPTLDVWSEALPWMKSKFTDDIYKRFYELRASGGHSVPAIVMFVPLICVDAPLYEVDVADDGNIQSITPKDYLLSAVRLPKWPSNFYNYLARSTPEALITIVNVDYLSDFLEKIADWFSNIGLFLQNTDEMAVRKAIMQGLFLESLLSTTEPHRPYDGLWRM